MFGVDVDKQVQSAVQPFLERLDGLQSTLDAILDTLQRRDDEISRLVDWQLKNRKRG